ncbi:MAG: hypothetical protein HWE09_00740 [Cyclobacteriaceae bacterium]|nr:hypothetical protein [Cyclobacteriaceae bacterium]
MLRTSLVFFISLSILVVSKTFGQNQVFILTPDKLEKDNLNLPDITNWKFKKGNDSLWSDPSFDDSSWTSLDSSDIANLKPDDSGFFEGWFRFKFKFEGEFEDLPSFLVSSNTAAQDIFLNGHLAASLGNTGRNGEPWKAHLRNETIPQFIPIEVNKEYLIAIHFIDFIDPGPLSSTEYNILGQSSFLTLTTFQVLETRVEMDMAAFGFFGVGLSIISLLAFLFFGLFFMNPKQSHLILIALVTTCIGFIPLSLFLQYQFESLAFPTWIVGGIIYFGFIGLFSFTPLLISSIFLGKIPKWLKALTSILALLNILSLYFGFIHFITINIAIAIFLIGYFIFTSRKNLKSSKWIVLAGIVFFLLLLTFYLIGNWIELELIINYRNFFVLFIVISFPISLLIYVAFWLKESLVKERQNAIELLKVTNEKKEILEKQNVLLEAQVEERTKDLNQSLKNLKSTQAQLIQSEKMASLGELTAGIAHEIQNPLNFVNNFSEVSEELLDEMNEEIEKGDLDEVKFIAADLKENLSKINHHGKRADAIVKGMLEHSRANKGEKAPTDLNALVDEFVRLSYHGLRAKDKDFNADFKLELDPDLPRVNLVASDIGRVILNLVNNAFYAINEKAKLGIEDYRPEVIVSTNKIENEVEISVKDNGSGIPNSIKDKILQPFFTTKPTGSGTGLGLSLSYDIVKAHGGELKVESKEGSGTTFSILLKTNSK